MQQKKQQNEEQEPLQESLQFKPGEYLVHLLIQQTRALQGEAESTIDPLIQIESMGLKKFSSQKKGAGQNSSTVWNEHFYFKRSFASGWQIQSQHVKISVLNHKVFGKDAVIGIYELDFSTIYMMENHVLQHKWLGLINPEKDFNKITGYLKVSINVVHDSDQQTTLQMDSEIKERGKIEESKSNLFAEGDLLLPPHIQTKGQQLKITLARANNLMKMDSMLGSIDPFIIFEIGGQEITTDLIKNNNAPIWETNLFLPVMSPCQSEYLIMRLFDYDMGGKDEIAGSQLFKIDEILSGKLQEPRWYNIYGAHIDAQSEQRVYLCSHPDLGTCFAGRLMLGISMVDSQQPKKSAEKITDQPTLQAIRTEQTYQWQLQCIVYFALNLPADDDAYSIKLKWGEYETKTSTEKAKNGVVEFYKLLLIENVKFPYKQLQDLPDIFLYLMDGDKPICFKRFKSFNLSADAENPDGRVFTVTLIPDKSLKNTPMDHPGIVKIKLLIQPTGQMIKLQPVNKPQRDANSFLYVNLFQANDLAPTDMDGLADPIVDIIFYDQKQSTVLINDTTSPIWNTQLKLPVYRFENDSFPPVIFRIFDVDKVSRDFMGQVILDFKKGVKKGHITMNQNHITKPQWVDVQLYGNKAGQILVSCNYVDNSQIKIPAQISPPRVKHFIKIKLLGMRNLKSFGQLPVTKAFAKFNVQSIRAKGEPRLLNQANEIITQPKEAGPNPNIGSIICLEIGLPDDDNFMPKLTGSVHDYIFKGVLQPLIGQFSIDLRLQKLKTLKQIEEKKDIAKRILNGTIQIESNLLHLPSLDLGVGIKMGALLSMASGEQFNEDVDTILKNIGVLENNSINMDKIIQFVEYQKNEEEGTYFEENRPRQHYIPLGYDTSTQKTQLYIQKQKFGNIQQKSRSIKKVDLQIEPEQVIKSNVHYRLCLPCPLEETVFMQQKVFDIFHLRKGSINLREVESMAEIILGVKDNEQRTGKLKGWVEVVSEQDLERLKQQPEFKLFKNDYDYNSSDTNLTDKELVVQNQVTIRLYIIDCANLPPKDEGSMSDPYLKIQLGKQNIDDIENRITDNCNPQYYKRFDITTQLPGASELIIQLWDYDEFMPDEMIGQTVIDIEERYFQSRFRQLKHIPIETRQLIHPSSSMPQGQIRLFLEIIPSRQTTLLKQPWFIEQRPKSKFQIRVVIWEVMDIPSHDDEGSSDLYVVGFIDDNQKQKTDTHFRSFNGKGSFNWRMLFNVELPQQQPQILTLQIFDKDIFTGDDYISDCSINITDLCKKASENETTVKMYSNIEPPSDGIQKQDNLFKQTKNGILYEKNIIVMKNQDKNGYKQTTDEGKIIISLEIVPEQFQQKNPVGLGRSEPNHSPILPEPTGRIEWTWNPLKMLNQLLGPKAIRYLLLGICICFSIYVFIMLFPIITGNLITHIFTG